ILVYDIRCPDAPVEKGRLPLPGKALSVDLDGKIACVALGKKGMAVVDLSKPAEPKLAGHIELDADAWDVKVRGNHAYLACMATLLVVVDISEPAKPKIAGRLEGKRGHSEIVFLRGKEAFLADAEKGLAAADIGKAEKPGEAGRWEDGGGYVEGVFASKRFAFVTFGRKRGEETGLRIIEVRNPKKMKQVGRIDFPGWVEGVVVHKTRAYVANTYQGLREIDVSNPAAPKEVKRHDVIADPDGGGRDLHWNTVKIFRQRKYEEAIRNFEAVVARQPKSNWSWYLLGRALFETGDFKRAEAAFSHLAKMCPWAPYFYHHGLTLEKLNRSDEAREAFKKALENIDTETGYKLFKYAANTLEGKAARSRDEVVEDLEKRIGGK
ncbi:MAG: tetratricopeptide repeat protein, partial [Planctomycetota bacterium]